MNLNEGKINALLILEVIGRPPEHLTETLNNLIEKIDEEEGVNIRDKKISEPKEMKEQKEFYTSFAEIEAEFKDLMDFVLIIFKYMPAHVEIIYPENISLTNNDCNEIFNELTRRLHGYDEIARILQMEKNILEKKLKELMPKDKK